MSSRWRTCLRTRSTSMERFIPSRHKMCRICPSCLPMPSNSQDPSRILIPVKCGRCTAYSCWRKVSMATWSIGTSARFMIFNIAFMVLANSTRIFRYGMSKKQPIWIPWWVTENYYESWSTIVLFVFLTFCLACPSQWLSFYYDSVWKGNFLESRLVSLGG